MRIRPVLVFNIIGISLWRSSASLWVTWRWRHEFISIDYIQELANVFFSGIVLFFIGCGGGSGHPLLQSHSQGLIMVSTDQNALPWIVGYLVSCVSGMWHQRFSLLAVSTLLMNSRKNHIIMRFTTMWWLSVSQDLWLLSGRTTLGSPNQSYNWFVRETAAFKKAARSGAKADYLKFKQLCNRIVFKLCRAKQNFFSSLHPTNQKEFWDLSLLTITSFHSCLMGIPLPVLI